MKHISLPALVVTTGTLLLPSGARAFDFGEDGPQLVYLLLLILLVGSSVVFHFRHRLGTAVRYAAVWGGIFLMLMVGYSFKPELTMVGERVMSNLVPGRGESLGTEVAFNADRSGHYVVDAQVNGRTITFLVDTGATQVVLSPEDARTAGLDPDNLAFSGRARTANGFVATAPVKLDSLEIGPIRVEGVSASVNSVSLDKSLLGMSFLNRIGGYRVEGGRLILSP